MKSLVLYSVKFNTFFFFFFTVVKRLEPEERRYKNVQINQSVQVGRVSSEPCQSVPSRSLTRRVGEPAEPSQHSVSEQCRCRAQSFP